MEGALNKLQKAQQPHEAQGANRCNQPILKTVVESDEEQYQIQKTVLQQKLYKVNKDQLKTLLHRSIGSLNFSNVFNKPCRGSGFVISKDIVITSAHNVYDRNTQSEIQSLRFYFEDNGVAKQYYKVEAFRYPAQYKTCAKKQQLFYDYAILKLQKQVPQEKFLQLSLPCQICLPKHNQQTSLRIFGYPIYENNFQDLSAQGSEFRLSQYGLTRNNRIVTTDFSSYKIGYQISTMYGQSGSPVAIGNKVIAIHNGNSIKDYNIGRMIDMSLYIRLEDWCQQLGGHPFEISSKNLCPHVEATLSDYLRKKDEQMKRQIINKQGQGLKTINLNKEKWLIKLNLSSNKLLMIDVSNNINLTHFQISENLLTAIDVSKNINLTYLDLSHNKISEINIYNNINLTEINLSHNRLIAIDVSNNIDLTHLDLYQNFFHKIDVSSNYNLVYLSLSSNKLSEIDVSNNFQLTHLDLRSNELSAIDVSNNLNLTYLDLFHNQISTIDVSSNTQLTQLCLSYNSLKSILLTYSSILYSSHYSDQQSLACEVKILYNEQDSQECKNQAKEWSKEYRKEGGKNKYKCNYVFICSQKSQ